MFKKLYLACDMEGMAGNCTWDEVDQTKLVYRQFQEIMTNEILNICEVVKPFFNEVYIKDGHWTETNIILDKIPNFCKIIRGDDGRNLTGLDSSFDAVILAGYHAAGGEITYPLSHTISDDTVYEVRLNGKRVGETTFAILNATKYNVPVIFISGDDSAIKEAKAIAPKIPNVITKSISNTSYICKSPQKVNEEIKKELSKSLSKFDKSTINIDVPKKFDLEIEYTSYRLAKKYSNYPNAKLINKTVKFKVKDLDELLRIYNLCI